MKAHSQQVTALPLHYQWFTTTSASCLFFRLLARLLCCLLLCLSVSTGSGVLRLNLRCKLTAGQSTAGLSAAHTSLRPMHNTCWWAASNLGIRPNFLVAIYSSFISIRENFHFISIEENFKTLLCGFSEAWFGRKYLYMFYYNIYLVWSVGFFRFLPVCRCM